MSATPGWCLRLKAQPDFRVDFGGVLPVRLAAMTADEVARVEVRHGNQMLALGELFDVAALGGADESSAELRLEGDLSRFVEEAVRAHILELSAEEAKASNAGVSETDLAAMVGEALDWAKAQQ